MVSKLLVTSQTVLLLFSPFTKCPLSTPSLPSSLYPLLPLILPLFFPLSSPPSSLPSLLLLPSLLFLKPTRQHPAPPSCPDMVPRHRNVDSSSPLPLKLGGGKCHHTAGKDPRPRGFFPSHILTRRSMDISIL